MKIKLSRKLLCGLVFVIFCSPALGWTYASHSVWDVLRQQFSLNHETTQSAVQAQLQWLTNHPNYIQKLIQSKPYIYHIITEIKKRHLPGEIALIPMIESAYDPFAYSGAGAAGLWQLMPGTGTDLGLKQDWWYDGRRSISSSTDAALNYLEYLHNFFNGNWILAFAAYDSGEGTVARIIKASGQSPLKVNFWTLPVPQETRAYVPRLLALAEIIQHAERYHINLPDIPHVPYFEEVNIGTQIDLNHAAKLAGISYRDLLKLNPGYNRWATAPYRPYKLLIPANKVESFNRNLALVPKNERVSWTRHQVSAGDNLSIIAERYHTTVNLIKELNQLKSNAVTTGQYVLIPKSKYTAELALTKQSHSHFTQPKAYKIIYIVDKHDDFSILEHKFHISTQQIKSWNNLDAKARLRPGQSLVIWKSNQHYGYKVMKGDSLSQIAHKYHINMQHILELNPGMRPEKLRAGQIILLG